MKLFSSPLRASLLAGALVCFFNVEAHAQSTNSTSSQITPASTAATPAKAIGPAPANSPQKNILSGALSPETRETLQQAMNSYNPVPAKPAPPAAGK